MSCCMADDRRRRKIRRVQMALILEGWSCPRRLPPQSHRAACLRQLAKNDRLDSFHAARSHMFHARQAPYRRIAATPCYSSSSPIHCALRFLGTDG